MTKPAPHERIAMLVSTDGHDAVGHVMLAGHKYDKHATHAKKRGVDPFKRTFDASPF